MPPEEAADQLARVTRALPSLFLGDPPIQDYNVIACHSSLGDRSPWQYRREVLEVVYVVGPICLANRGAGQ